MDRVLLKALNGYTKILKEGKNVSSKEKNNLFSLVYIYNFIKSSYAKLLSDEKMNVLEELYDCIRSNSCLMDKNFHLNKEYIFDVIDNGINTFDNNPIFNFAGNRMVSSTGKTVTFGDFNYIQDMHGNELIVGYNPDTNQEVRIFYGMENIF